MKVMLLGATGLTGRSVLSGLLEASEVSKVIALVRRPIDMEHAKLQAVVVDFDRLNEHADCFDVSVVVCCLGSTIKAAGSMAQFRKVDYQYCLEAARIARAHGANALLLMSAIGASSRSSVFYNRTKGELEDAVRELGFDVLSIFHPSLLLGDRREQRLAESAASAMAPVLNGVLLGPLRPYRAIRAEAVAQAMVNEVKGIATASSPARAVNVWSYDDILAKSHQA
ncbi:NAD(P)H-binding protein [Marinobacter caseinilyticus]|uniref:NAD(P)H-binding protein n=1 Tax=Marinobacter caseinilyticus TaxID=2692195 RepID=UPI0014087468|nr:NAD(P)H-binding protein [Marinobacter caseinilyticus]